MLLLHHTHTMCDIYVCTYVGKKLLLIVLAECAIQVKFNIFNENIFVLVVMADKNILVKLAYKHKYIDGRPKVGEKLWLHKNCNNFNVGLYLHQYSSLINVGLNVNASKD